MIHYAEITLRAAKIKKKKIIKEKQTGGPKLHKKWLSNDMSADNQNSIKYSRASPN